MAKTPRVARPLVILLALVLTAATVPSQVRDAPVVGRLTGEMVVQSPEGRTIGKLEATVSYSLPEQGGRTGIRFTPPDRATTVSASAEFTAVRQEEAFGAVTALMLALSGQVGNDRTSLRLGNVRVEGDLGALRGHVSNIIAWWDEQAGIPVPGYVSPAPNSANIGKLVLNVWGGQNLGTIPPPIHGYAILMFDPLNSGVISSGRVVWSSPGSGIVHTDVDGVFFHGTLTPMVNTPMPNDYQLTVFSPSGTLVNAEIVIEPLPDGTFDVRGAGIHWVTPGAFTVEGVGTAAFTPPGSIQ